LVVFEGKITKEKRKVENVLSTPNLTLNTEIVGKSAVEVANMAGFSVPPNTRVLIGYETHVGKKYPFSWEKLCPVLGFYVEDDWQKACERAIEILKFSGIGHTLSIHSKNEKVIMEFALKKPAFRILINTASAIGAIGGTTGLDPSLTLGCGTWGGNITADNVTPKHLLNIKRVAYETSPFDLDRERAKFSDEKPPLSTPGSTSVEESENEVERVLKEFLTKHGIKI
jgi:acetaldehyde dehydrogenase (acetylating)